MTGTTVRELWASGAEKLAQGGIDSARLDARLLLALAVGAEGFALPAIGDVAPAQRNVFEALITRRAAREPMAYIRGSKEFWSLDFEVGSGVLIPRPETETLVEQALLSFADREGALAVLDLGTGSGCLLISFLCSYPDARGVGIDSSPEALAWAQRNVVRHELSPRCELRRGNWNSAAGVFDVVFVNPPYLTDDEFARSPPEISSHEPRSAFVAGTDGLDCYRNFGPAIVPHLAPKGLAFVEIGMGQGDPVTAIMEAAGLEVTRIAPDLSGIPRCAVIGRRG